MKLIMDTYLIYGIILIFLVVLELLYFKIPLKHKTEPPLSCL